MKYLQLMLIVIITPLLFSMDWPSSSGLMRRNFGWNNEGLPHLGVSFDADEAIMAVENGELLYRRLEEDTASRLPSPLGTWTALDHGDGIISIYSRFEGKFTPSLPEYVEKGRLLGESGISGWSSRKGFYFQLFDRKERRWINPAMIINPPQDSGTPVILSVRLRDSGGRILELGQERTINQGNYAILVETARIIQGRNPLAPFRIICSVNGIETGGLVFETYSARDGVLMVYRNGLVPVRQVYSPYPAYELGTAVFARGQVTFEIIAQDAEGNSRNAVFRFTVE